MHFIITFLLFCYPDRRYTVYGAFKNFHEFPQAFPAKSRGEIRNRKLLDIRQRSCIPGTNFLEKEIFAEFSSAENHISK